MSPELLTRAANAAFAEANIAAGVVLRRAVQLGRFLRYMKWKVGHGHFYAWIEDHCDFTVRTANRYMQIARCVGSHRTNVSVLGSLRDALTHVKRLDRGWSILFAGDDYVRLRELLTKLHGLGDPVGTILDALQARVPDAELIEEIRKEADPHEPHDPTGTRPAGEN